MSVQESLSIYRTSEINNVSRNLRLEISWSAEPSIPIVIILVSMWNKLANPIYLKGKIRMHQQIICRPISEYISRNLKF